MVCIADNAVELREAPLLGLDRGGDSDKHGYEVFGCDVSHAVLLIVGVRTGLARSYGTRNIAQSQGWSRSEVNSSSSSIREIEAPAISSEVQ